MLSLENTERLDLLEDLLQKGATRNHEVTHPRTPISQIASADQSLDVLQARSSRRTLRERDTRSDVVPELVLLLSDELEVNASISVEESRNIGRF